MAGLTPLAEPTTTAGRAALAELISEPARSVVAVDFDGTLAPIVARPEDARPAPGAVEALAALAQRVGVCAVVSGRGAADVVALGGLDAVDRLRVLGHYGLERWQAGRLDSPDVAAGVDEARIRLAELVRESPEGVHIEDKGHSLVVHTRPAADPAAALAALVPPAEEIAALTGLEVVPGRMVLELRPPGTDKGGALEALVVEHDARAVLYVGDDLGDLPAYDMVTTLRDRGVPGLAVASVDPTLDDAPEELAQRADLVLPGPSAVVEFLAVLASRLG